MYFEKIEKNQTKLWIINSLLKLLEKKDYSSITINMIVDHGDLADVPFIVILRPRMIPWNISLSC